MHRGLFLGVNLLYLHSALIFRIILTIRTHVS